MPFFCVSLDALEEMVGELDAADELPPGTAGEFYYESTSAQFTAGALGSVARVMLEFLIAAGATGFRVRYDGGYDEGFAHPEALLFGEKARPVAEAMRELTTPELIVRIREAAARESAWGNAAEWYESASSAEAAMSALDELAGELATKLLGEGFGTGEYELYGAFTADLKSGDLVDDPTAAKPEHMD